MFCMDKCLFQIRNNANCYVSQEIRRHLNVSGNCGMFSVSIGLQSMLSFENYIQSSIFGIVL